MHLFLPSRRSIMTVVGKGGEHWVDTEFAFCSCPAYYFATTGGRNAECYHLGSALLAIETGAVEKTEFDDEEFDGFVRGLVMDL